MPFESHLELPIPPVPLVSTYRNNIETFWKTALVKEGFGRENILENNVDRSVSVTDEIDTMLLSLKMQAFYETSDFFIDLRKAFLAEYSAPYVSYNTLKRSVLPTTSFVGDTIRNIALLYKQPAKRNYGKADEPYQMMLKECAMNRVAKYRHRMLVLHNLIATRPVVRVKNGNHVMMLDVLTPDQFRVLVDENENVTKILYGGYREINGVTSYVIYVWTDTEHYYISDNKRYEVEGGDGVNPYGRIPFHFTKLEPGQDIYSGGMHSLVESNIYVNYLRLLENTDATFCTANVFLGVNMKMGDNPVVSPREVYTVDEITSGEGNNLPPTGEFISGTPNAQLLRDLADAEEMRAKMSAGISPAMLEKTVTEMSGRALEQMYRPLLDIREDHIDIMRDDEAELSELMNHIANIERAMGNYPQLKAELPTDSRDFSIDFADISFDDLKPDEKYDLFMRQAKDGTRRITDVFMYVNPDVDDPDEAEKAMRENAALARELTRSGFGTDFLSSVNSQPETEPDTANNIGA